MNATRTYPLVALLAALSFTLLLAACGGGDPEDFDNADGGRKGIDPPACSASGVCR